MRRILIKNGGNTSKGVWTVRGTDEENFFFCWDQNKNINNSKENYLVKRKCVENTSIQTNIIRVKRFIIYEPLLWFMFK